jgi:hypothetical protein
VTAGHHTPRKEWMMEQIYEAENEALCAKLIEEFYAKAYCAMGLGATKDHCLKN